MIAVDLFAGAGGFSQGAVQAGVQVAWAGNHWPLAVQYHALNHPGTAHACQDLHQTDWRDVPSHDIQMASPACQGHSRARGKDRPHHDVQRSTAWAVVSCAEYHRSPVVLVENVPAFERWLLYPAWRAAMGALGYQVAPHVLDAADFGVPQHRERLFLVCTRSKAPLHLDLTNQMLLPIREVIQWNRHRWSLVARTGRSEATLRRYETGRRQFGERFVMPYYGSGSGLTGRSIDRPIGTITTLDRWAVVNGDRMRMLQPDELRVAMGFPSDYLLPKTRREAIHLLGNAVCPPVAATILTALQRQA